MRRKTRRKIRARANRTMRIMMDSKWTPNNNRKKSRINKKKSSMKVKINSWIRTMLIFRRSKEKTIRKESSKMISKRWTNSKWTCGTSSRTRRFIFKKKRYWNLNLKNKSFKTSMSQPKTSRNSTKSRLKTINKNHSSSNNQLHRPLHPPAVVHYLATWVSSKRSSNKSASRWTTFSTSFQTATSWSVSDSFRKCSCLPPKATPSPSSSTSSLGLT